MSDLLLVTSAVSGAPVAGNATHGPAIPGAAAEDRVDQVPVTTQAIILQYLTIGWFYPYGFFEHSDRSGFVGPRGLEGEADRVMIAITALGQIFAEKVLGHMAVVAIRDRAMGSFAPRS